jgi:hypothetical protein
MHALLLSSTLPLYALLARIDTHTRTHIQPFNAQRLIYQSSCVYVCAERERKLGTHTHIHYLKQRRTSIRPSTATSKRRKKGIRTAVLCFVYSKAKKKERKKKHSALLLLFIEWGERENKRKSRQSKSACFSRSTAHRHIHVFPFTSKLATR